MSKIFLCLFFLLSTIASFAQKPLYSYQTWFKVEDGLPQGFISEITQDDDGFIWISTLDGLARYDGRKFMVFHQQVNDTTSISSNVINEMVYSRDGKLWLFSQGQQVDAFNPRSFRLFGKTSPVLTDERKKNQFQTRPEHRGIYWTTILEQGISWIDPNTLRKGEANVKNGLLKEDTILASATAADGRIWLISSNYIQISDSTRSHFAYTPIKRKIPSDILVSRNTPWVVDGDNFIFITSTDLWFINCKTGDYKKFEVPSKDEFQHEYSRIRKGLDGRIYLRSTKGIYRIEPTGAFTLLWKNNILTDRRPTSFFVDRSEVLWIGLDAWGLVKVNLRSMPLNSFSYNVNFHTDILTELGISPKMLPATWKLGLWSYNFRYTYGKDSALYLASNDNSLKDYEVFSYRNKKLTRLPLPAEIILPVFHGLYTNKDGGIWALDSRNKSLLYWKDDHSIPVQYPVNLTTHSDLMANMIVSDSFQWITTYGEGFYKLKNGLKVDHADKTTLPNDVPYDLTDICADPGNPQRLWIGSRGGGLILWDINKKFQREFTTNDGLPNNTIYCIVPDRFGKLWLSTNKGICRFDPVSFEAYNFEKSDGLPGNEFNRSHKFIFPDGRIALGGVDGYVIFQPADFSILKDTTTVRLQLTKISVNNEELFYGGTDKLITAPLTEIKELILPYNKNYINISFAALQYNESQKIRYRYRLKGSSNEWIETGFDNTAYYTQLSPGKYELEINATNLNGNWGVNTRSLKITILPPFWKTWWAYSIYLFVAIALILYYLRYRDKQVKAKQQLIFEQKEKEKLQELDEVKTRFFSNITHEFRTPLTLITGPLEKMIRDERLPAPLLNSVYTMQRNAAKLLTLINQLLDLSKIEAGQMKLFYSTGQLELFIADLVELFKPAASEKSIRLTYHSEAIEGIYRFDSEKWEKCLSNLLGNALKFTPPNGEINVVLNSTPDNQIQLRVKDTGPGIPFEQQQKIFERFYQADSSSTRNYEGTGIGLSLVKELAKLMGGTIQLESKPDEGALFILTVPVEKQKEVHGKFDSNILAKEIIKSTEADSIQRDKPLVLVVEDNEELRLFIAEILAETSHVLQAPDGKAAWEIILQEMPDLVVSDLMMPYMDGVELCSLTKNDPRTSHIGFILLTAKANHSSKMEGLGTGADDYIHKPFHLDELQMRVHNLLQLQEKMRTHLQKQLLPASPAQKPVIVINPFLNELYAILDEQLDHPQLGVEQLANSMKMSKSTLNRKLKSILNLSANDLIRRYRLQRAVVMMQEGIDISTVAYRSGFSSPSYFAQCFREQYGTTPSLFLAEKDMN